ncbi:class I SAM-dependent methyltransferase [bacterium]|nr:class I SAM-dependent methyltransferase [bacterium]
MARGHRMFAALWDSASRREDAHMRDVRRQVVGGVRGNVLEVGAGTGANWEFLPPGVSYTGVEPDPHMRRRAAANAQARGGGFVLGEARAEALAFDDASFDSILATFVLCSVDDQPAALAEIFRVLRPGGEFHYVEHVRPDGMKGRVFDLLTPAWRLFAANCHPNRQTAQAIERAGFTTDGMRRTVLHGLPNIYGVAVRPR